MSDQTKSAAPAASGAAFNFRGKEYFLPRLCDDDRDEFLVWCNAQALAAHWKLQAMVHEGVLTPMQWAEDRSLTDQRIKTGYFHLDEPGGSGFFFARAGMMRLVWICLKRRDPTTPIDVVRDMIAANGEEWVRQQYHAANADPTVPSPRAGASDGTSGNTSAVAAASIAPPSAA